MFCQVSSAIATSPDHGMNSPKLTQPFDTAPRIVIECANIAGSCAIDNNVIVACTVICAAICQHETQHVCVGSIFIPAPGVSRLPASTTVSWLSQENAQVSFLARIGMFEEQHIYMAVDYLPLLILITIATGVAILAMLVPNFLGPRRDNKQKLEPYESGIIPFVDARRPFPVKYYLVAMLFILFDIEVIFLYPWAGVLRELRDISIVLALAPMGFFLLILVIGLLYEWKKGALDWR